jgi:hypothetical protein
MEEDVVVVRVDVMNVIIQMFVGGVLMGGDLVGMDV